MKQLFLIAILLSSVVLFAGEGEVLFGKKCASCHTPFIPMSKLKENFLDRNNTLLKLKAPTLNQLSYRLKQRIGDPKGDEDIHRMEVTAFMSDYVLHPDKQKSVCREEVLRYFDTMPSLQGQVTEDELEAIGDYLYDFDKKVIAQNSVRPKGFEEALKRAKKEHKIVMIEAMSEDCHFCRKMEREVMIEDDVVKALNDDFISVVVDVKKHALPLGLKAPLTPTFIFVDANGKVLLNIPGAWGKEDFLALLKEAKEKAKATKKE